MSKLLRKPLSLLLALTLLISVAGIAFASDAQELEPITLRWVGAEYGPVADDAPVVKMVEEKFNVTIEPVYIEASKKAELLGLMFASNDVPDIWSAPTMIAYREWARQEVLAKIDEAIVTQYAPAIADEINSWIAETGDPLWKWTLVDGVSYGIPQLNVDSTYPQPVIWRDDWLENVGIDKIPETIEEFETALYAFTNDDPDQNGKNDTYGLSKEGLNAIYGITGYYREFWQERDGQLVYGGIQPEYKEVLGMLAKWYADGVIDPEFAVGENQGGYWAVSHSFVNGVIGMTGMANFYHWNYPYFEGGAGGVGNYENFVQLQPEGHYAFGTPATKDGVGGRNVGSIAASATCFGYQLEEETAKLERIMLILNEGATDFDYYMYIKNGIEGEHRDLVHGDATYKEEFKAVDAQSALGASNMFCPWQSMRFYKLQRPNNYNFADSTVGLYSKIKNVVTEQLPSEIDYRADLEKLMNETYTAIISGNKPVDYFDDFVAEWLKSGGQQLTDEANAWYAAQ